VREHGTDLADERANVEASSEVSVAIAVLISSRRFLAR
jgi:hypothetical protein